MEQIDALAAAQSTLHLTVNVLEPKGYLRLCPSRIFLRILFAATFLFKVREYFHPLAKYFDIDRSRLCRRPLRWELLNMDKVTSLVFWAKQSPPFNAPASTTTISREGSPCSSAGSSHNVTQDFSQTLSLPYSRRPLPFQSPHHLGRNQCRSTLGRCPPNLRPQEGSRRWAFPVWKHSSSPGNGIRRNKHSKQEGIRTYCSPRYGRPILERRVPTFRFSGL